MPLAFTIPLVLVSIASFLMQARRIHQYGAAGVSRSTWLGLLVTVTLWGVYGITVSDLTITATNVGVRGDRDRAGDGA